MYALKELQSVTNDRQKTQKNNFKNFIPLKKMGQRRRKKEQRIDVAKGKQMTRRQT